MATISQSVPVLASTSRQRATRVLTGLLLVSLLSFAIACAIGSVALSPAEVWSGLRTWVTGAEANMAATLVELRLNRALSAFVTGATLALAGVMMQALLRNSLAEPYVLGVSGGAAVGALSSMFLVSVAWMIDLSAFIGAVTISMILYFLARRDFKGSGGADGSAPLLLLTGVILASGCGALVTLMLSIAPDNRLRGMVFWLIGDLSGSQFRWLPWIVLIAALAFTTRAARSINLLAQHAEAALTLGVDVARMRIGLFLCAALLTASAVSNAGSIGFVGLIVPHACRFMWGSDHRLLLPAAALTGGAFLVLADTLARSVVAPQQLPVGVITAMIGVPVFLLQLHQLRKR